MGRTPSEAVDTANRAFGRHPGFRALHAKGILCAGTFTASSEAAALTAAAHMQGDPVPATFRLSNGGGAPHAPDYAPDLRGLAAKLYLPDGSRTDLVTVSTPLFVSSTPDAFVWLMEAQGAGPAAVVKLPVLLARHPWLVPRLARAARGMRPPASYALIRYYSQHAFKWIDSTGTERHVRYTVVPEAGEEPYLSWPEARRRGKDYLQEELRHRLEGGPVRFSLEVQIAAPGDPVNDPSQAWPQARRRVTVGTYELTGLDHEREKDGDILVFDPTRVTAGIECSEDPVLAFRSPAYRESVARRSAPGG